MTYLIRLVWRALSLIDFILMTFIAWSLALLPRTITASFYEKIFRVWCQAFTQALGTKTHIHQHYVGALPEQYILIANHPSAFEDIGIPAVFPVTSLAKAEVKKWLLLGKISLAAGTLYVQREEKESRQAALDSMVNFLASGRNLAIYPEGGCKGRRIFQRFQRGAFSASIKTGVPILPVFIQYEASESFEWAGQTLVQKILELATAPNKNVNFHVFEPLRPQDYADENAMKEAAHTMYVKWDERFFP